MQKLYITISWLWTSALMINALILITNGKTNAQCRELAWYDEFDKDGLPDPTKWSHSIGGHGWGNNELQYYTDRSKNARVENGSLIIEAHKEVFTTNQYTSAKLNSKFSLKYGRVEMRAIMPNGRGTWAAMWMLPTVWNYGNGSWPDNGEIDILEYVGHDPNVPHASVHTHTYNWANGNVKSNWTKAVTGLETAYHIYALEWNENQMDFYIDDLKYLSVYNENTGWETWPFDKEFYLILNLAIGGSWGGEKGVDNTIFPTRYVIDYVRMYADPVDFLKISGTSKVYKDSTYTYSVPSYEEATYSWNLPESATAVSRTDSHAVQVKWGDAGGNVSVDITKPCDAFTTDLDVLMYDPLVQLPFQGTPWPIPGKIEVEHFDTGGNGIGYHDLSEGNNGPATVRAGEDVDLGNCNDIGQTSNLGWTDNGEWLEYTVEVAEDGYYDFNIRVATENSGTMFHIDIDGLDVTGPIVVPNTGNWQTWQTKTVHYKYLTSGKHIMRVAIDAGGFDINYFDITEGTMVTGISNSMESYRALTLSPNPAQDYVQIDLSLHSDNKVLITIANNIGQVVYENEYTHPSREFRTNLNVSSLRPGIYTIQCQQGDQVYFNKLIVK